MHKKIPTSRDLKIFGIIWSAIFAVIFYKTKSAFVLLVALLFFIVAIVFPQVFLQTRFYQIWIRFGDLLGKINGFLISFILFYVIFTPVAILLKLMKKDLLSKKLDRAKSSYFIDRKEQPHSMKNQF
jgi:uncharacterized membrane protein